jgi:hypothetical protein
VGIAKTVKGDDLRKAWRLLRLFVRKAMDVELERHGAHEASSKWISRLSTGCI